MLASFHVILLFATSTFTSVTCANWDTTIFPAFSAVAVESTVADCFSVAVASTYAFTV